MELVLENVRCFVGHHSIPIKPITFLIGENSSGKSTFLAALSAVYDFGYPLRPRFNEAPYSLGSYDTIATVKVGRSGRAKHFTLGYREDDAERGEKEVSASYTGREGVVEIEGLYGKTPDLSATISFSYEKLKTRITVQIEYKGKKYDLNSELEGTSSVPAYRVWDQFMFSSAFRNRKEFTPQFRARFWGLFDEFDRSSAISIAPIRTRPRRTYDQVSEDFTPEGEHIPFVLSGLLQDEKNRAILERFGQESGLFREIGVRRLGKKVSDPIQVLVTNAGRPANLLDVGYGVSQALPVVVQSMLVSPAQLVLLQQPEVHLHPKAQAALGSLFVDLHTDSGKCFVIETHSDYIIDRVRQEVAKKRIGVDEVQILYFDKKGSETTVYPINLDAQGNIMNAPPSYRDFFLQEEVNLLSR